MHVLSNWCTWSARYSEALSKPKKASKAADLSMMLSGGSYDAMKKLIRDCKWLIVIGARGGLVNVAPCSRRMPLNA